MSFTSFHFVLFLPIVVAIYFMAPKKYMWIILLVASWYFYMSWQPIFLLLLIYVTAVSFFPVFPMVGAQSEFVKRVWLTISVVLTVLPLALFKYFNFLNHELGRLLGLNISNGPGVLDYHFILPVGISFFTFQALSYVIDAYYGRVKTERFGIYALYIAFFPQLVAGPIERATHLLPQMTQLRDNPNDPIHAFDGPRAVEGARLILWGLLKKLVIADNLGQVVDVLYGAPGSFSGFQMLLATYFFAYQIYCDFSGYTDIARGVAKIFGFELMLNFNSPYMSQSIPEFWRRWHISLSTWFRDYVYKPLGEIGGRRNGGCSIFPSCSWFPVSGMARTGRFWPGARFTRRITSLARSRNPSVSGWCPSCFLIVFLCFWDFGASYSRFISWYWRGYSSGRTRSMTHSWS